MSAQGRRINIVLRGRRRVLVAAAPYLLVASVCGAVAIGLAPAATPSLAGGLGTTLAKSGFENVTMDAARNPAQDQSLFLHGTDSLTGFNWDAASFAGSSWRMSGIICGNAPCPSGNSTDYFESLLGAVAGPYGTSTKALKIGFRGKASPFCCQQIFLETASLTSPVTDYYTRYWIRLNPAVRAQANSQGTNYWRMLWEFKTWSDYRVQIDIMNHRKSGPHWYVQADSGGWNSTGQPTKYWSVNSHIRVPLKKWFYIEISLHRAQDKNGRFFFAVNGQKIVDRFEPNYGANNDEIAIIAHSMLYSTFKSKSYQWIDDFEVRDLPPCRRLPCGPPRKLD